MLVQLESHQEASGEWTTTRPDDVISRTPEERHAVGSACQRWGRFGHGPWYSDATPSYGGGSHSVHLRILGRSSPAHPRPRAEWRMAMRPFRTVWSPKDARTIGQATADAAGLPAALQAPVSPCNPSIRTRPTAQWPPKSFRDPVLQAHPQGGSGQHGEVPLAGPATVLPDRNVPATPDWRVEVLERPDSELIVQTRAIR